MSNIAHETPDHPHTATAAAHDAAPSDPRDTGATAILGASSDAGALTLAGGLAAAASFVAAAAPLMAQTSKGTGSPGPGVFRGDTVPLNDYNLTGVLGEETFDTFGCKVFKGSPDTPDWRSAKVYFERKFYENPAFRLPDGKSIAIWGFEDTLKGKGQTIYPSPMIRVTEGDMVHVKLDQKKGTHTIHHHGIEPTTMNDGVGHVSFEVEQSYIYQWQPRHAGTWFYHCHKNTVLHFEYGMFGLLIVDPKPDAQGKIRAFEGGPDYDVEAFWVADDMDPRWHTLGQEAGLCGEDARLNVFKPQYFFLTGVANYTSPSKSTRNDVKTMVTARRGNKVLIRLLNASYSVLSVTFSKFDVQIISVDGHSLNKPWNKFITIPKGTPIQVATASRYDLLIDTTTAEFKAAFPIVAGQSRTVTDAVTFEWQDWITRKVHNADLAGAPEWKIGRATTIVSVT